MKRRRIAILGSTGSIGRQTLEVISQRDELEACALAAGKNWKLLAEQISEFNPQIVALEDEGAAGELRGKLPSGTKLLSGPAAMTELVRESQPDVLLSGVVGAAGLEPTLAGIECGAIPAIANKETLVMAGAVIMPAARRAGLDVLPVDSEHSGIFQCLRSGNRDEVRRVVITASGGALRDWDAEKISSASVDDALNHPTWSMGPKITIDSATLINKAMEIVEAHWLFGLAAEQIEVVLHPQSIVHSYVEFRDGSVIAQMGAPDMTLPITYALCFPGRVERNVPPLDLAGIGELTFRPCEGRFARAVNLGYEAIRRGGLAGAVLNAANESAVAAFLAGKISFEQIVEIVEEILNLTPNEEEITLDALIRADRWARTQVAERIGQTA
ncbi:MAG: 1-deoxy-D-xylulose-5-phosphate reductoisomerase [Planctomycetota bacterium]|jgi:1-deoxy-D-xylulose-5-phosphate reductoisomerase